MSAWWWLPLLVATAAAGIFAWLSRRLRSEAAALRGAGTALARSRARIDTPTPGRSPPG